MSIEYPIGIINGVNKGVNSLRFEFYESTEGLGSINEQDDIELKNKTSQDIYLYLPNITSASAVTWDNTDVKHLLKGSDSTNLESLFDIGTQQLKETYQGFLSSITRSKTTGQDLQDLKSKSIDNPYKRALFRGVDFRTFNFTWNFLPKSKEESELIKNIIFTFRKANYPSISKESKFRLKYPDTVLVTPLRDGEKHPFLPLYKPMIISNVSHDYNDNITGSFVNGSPIKQTLTINFTEIETLVSEDIIAGY